MRKQETLHPDDLMKPDRVSEVALLGSGVVMVVLLLLMMLSFLSGGVAHH